MALFRDAGCRPGEAFALGYLGELELRQGRHVQAAGHFRQSLGLHREAGNCSGQAEALNGLGEAFLAASQAGQASARHAAALALALQVGDKHEEARARRFPVAARRACVAKT